MVRFGAGRSRKISFWCAIGSERVILVMERTPAYLSSDRPNPPRDSPGIGGRSPYLRSFAVNLAARRAREDRAGCRAAQRGRPSICRAKRSVSASPTPAPRPPMAIATPPFDLARDLRERLTESDRFGPSLNRPPNRGGWADLRRRRRQARPEPLDRRGLDGPRPSARKVCHDAREPRISELPSPPAHARPHCRTPAASSERRSLTGDALTRE
jgi:hypothetical protein